MVIADYKPEHMKRLVANGPEMEFARTMAAAAGDLDKLGPARTLLDGDTVVACVGVCRLWGGVGEAWAVLSESIYKHPLALQKAMLGLLKEAEDEHGFYRIGGNVVDGFAKGFRWLESLGFEYEGKMPMYGPNKETYLRFGRWHQAPQQQQS